MEEINLDRIRDLINQEKTWGLIELYNSTQIHPADWADFLEQLSLEELAKYIELVGPEKGLPVFQFVSFENKKKILENLPKGILSKLLSKMNPDDRADIVEDLDEDMKDYILSLLFLSERQNVLKLISYPEDSAGAFMTTEYAILRTNDTVEQALEEIRLQAPKKENVYYIYVVDSTFRLVGFISLRRLIMSPRKSIIKNIMDKNAISVEVDEDIENVAEKIRHYDFLAMPVVDHDKRMVGLITFDDVYDIIHQEATEDMYLLANLDTEESVESPFYRSVKLRIPWLLLNLCTGLLVAYTINTFRDSISEYVALAVMMPLIGLLGGNAGNQSLTVVVRALALGQIKFERHWRVLLKEIGVGLMNGMVLGLVLAGISLFCYKNPWLAVIILISMTVNLIIAGLFGSMVPLLLRKFKFDPALGSSILVTTATDVGGFFIFLSLATILLQQLLGG